MSALMVGTQQGHRNNRKAILNPSLSSLILKQEKLIEIKVVEETFDH
jgi:hypothetical protein